MSDSVELPDQVSGFRRRILIDGQPQGDGIRMRAALEDDFHHFRVHLFCEDGRVTEASGEAPRHPYSMCALATTELSRLVGMPLGAVAHAVTRFTEASEQCTHLLDLAGLAIAAASRSIPHRQYDMMVPDRDAEGRTTPTLCRDRAVLLTWSVVEDMIEGPTTFAGVNLRGGMARWAMATLGVEEAEAALILRRCTTIAIGRTKNLDAELHARATGYCFAQQPRRAEQAIRVQRSTADFSGAAELLCAADVAWVAGRALDPRPAAPFPIP